MHCENSSSSTKQVVGWGTSGLATSNIIIVAEPVDSTGTAVVTNTTIANGYIVTVKNSGTYKVYVICTT